jgi:rRNA-processing protein EBP2
MGKLKDSLLRLKESIGSENAVTSTKKLSGKIASKQEDDEHKRFDTSRLMESDSEEDEEDDEDEEDKEEGESAGEGSGDEEEDGSDELEDHEDVPLSDVELDDDADVVPFQKTTVNNKAALKQALSTIALPAKGLEFFQHMSVTNAEPIVLKDIYDDLERELAFYKQGVEAVKIAKKSLAKENIPFTRPTDYFAEMVKSDEHMDRLKQKLIEEATSKKVSQDAKRQRELKKFGKQVQHAKLQERQKEKRDTMDKIKSLKRKRVGNEITSEDFDIAVEEAAGTENRERGQRGGRPNAKRMAKNTKYGFGGKKRYEKSNDAKSSMDMSGFSAKRMKSSKGAKPTKSRPGKSKRTKH